MRILMSYFAVSTLLVFVPVGEVRAQGETEELLEEALSHWEELEQAGRRLEGSFTLNHPINRKKGVAPPPTTGKFLVEGTSAWVRTRQKNTAVSPSVYSESLYGNVTILLHDTYSYSLSEKA